MGRRWIQDSLGAARAVVGLRCSIGELSRLDDQASHGQAADATTSASRWLLSDPNKSPLGTMAAYLLEPDSDENLVTWGFLDGYVDRGKVFPIARVKSTQRLPSRNQTSGIAPAEKLTLDSLFSPQGALALTTQRPNFRSG